MTTKETWILINAAFNAWSDDHVQSMGAALAYYTMFSIAPLLLIVIVIAIAGLAFGEEAACGEIAGQFQTLIGEQGALAIQALVESVNQPTKGFTATLIGGGLLLIGATRPHVYPVHYRQIFDRPVYRQKRGDERFWRGRFAGGPAGLGLLLRPDLSDGS